MQIYVDGDGCPVKEEVYRVAKRYALHVLMVCNSPLRIPKDSSIEPIVVGAGFDKVDDWIVEHVQPFDIVVTNDILLSARCVAKEARVIDPRGRVLDENNIGEAVATRELMAHLRQFNETKLGPKPKTKRHQSEFLANLDTLINALQRETRKPS